MNLHTYNQENGKRYTAASIKTKKPHETDDGVTDAEESKIIIKALRTAGKIASGELKTRPFNEDGWFDELKEWADNERKKENG